MKGVEMGVRIELWGDYACFSRPEMKVERVSYDVITPSAARGIIEAVYWHPGMRWIIDRIYVMNPIRFSNIRRNEVTAKINASTVRTAMKGTNTQLYISTQDTIQQRAAMVLRNVRYVIDAHFEMTGKAAASDNEGKFSDIIKRRLERGQCYHQPCFGCREFPAYFREWKGGAVVTAYENTEKDLGFMLYDMDYCDRENITPMFFRAVMKNGVIDLTDCEVKR